MTKREIEHRSNAQYIVESMIRKAKGQCVRCGNPSITADGFCAQCRDKMAEPISLRFKNKGGLFDRSSQVARQPRRD